MPSEHFARTTRQARLAERARRGDERARESLVRELLPLARRVARRFASPHQPAEDLAQVAGIGLLKAIDRFDPTRGAAFATYAQALMTGEVRHHLRDTRLMRVPGPIYDQVPRFQAAFDRLTAELGRSPSWQEVADALELSREEVVEIAEAAISAAPISLELSLAELGGEAAPGEHDEAFERVDTGLALAPMLRGLSPRERMILDLRFDEGLSQSEIGEGLGISQTQVSRLLRRALAKLSQQAALAAA